MFKKLKLKRLQALRKKRDEILNTDNEGRADHLMFGLPGVSRVYTRGGGFGKSYCEVQFEDGFEFTGWGGSILEALQDVVTEVYLKSITYL